MAAKRKTKSKTAPKKSRPTHGGARPGAGRKPKRGPTVSTTVRLPRVMRDFLDSDVAPGDSLTDAIVAIVGRTRAYRDYLAKNELDA